MTSRRLTPEEVAEVAGAAAENAYGLMHAAMILVACDVPVRGYALGVIAAEEMAKYVRCRELLKQGIGDLTAHGLNGGLNEGGKAHETRYAEALKELWRYDPTVPPPGGDPTFQHAAREDQKARERALYVDVNDDGRVRRPNGVPAEEAKRWVEGVAKLFNRFQPVWEQELADALRAAKEAERPDQALGRTKSQPGDAG